jgi:hypothetical protein
VIRVPERFSKVFPKFPFFQKLPPRREIELAHIPPEGGGVHFTFGAYTPVAIEDPVSEIARIGTKLPLVDARLAAEGPTPFRYLARTPPAEGPA